jgi:hypothetical protein
MLRNLLFGGLVCLGFCTFTGNAQAQVIWGGEAERYFRPGTYLPNDGIIPQVQYGYSTNASFLQYGAGNFTGSRLNYLDYYDRLERAYKFGYPIPASPYQSTPSTTYSPFGCGLGLGIFRR